MLKLFRNLRKEEWALALLSVFFIVVQVWLELTMPEYMAEITTLVQTEGSTMGEILSAGGKMLLRVVLLRIQIPVFNQSCR